MSTQTETRTEPVESTRQGRTPARWWLLGLLVTCGLSLARLPVVIEEVRTGVQDQIASGALPSTDQERLAITIGVAGASVIYLVIALVIVIVASRIERRLALPPVPLPGGASLPGLPYLVFGISIGVQAVALATASVSPRSEGLVWAAVLLVLIYGVGSLAVNSVAPSLLARFSVAGLVLLGVFLVL